MGPAGPEQAGAAGLGRRLAPSRAAGRLQPGGRCRVGEPGAPPGEGGEGGGGRIFTPFFKRRPGPCLLELSARSFRAGLWFSAGPASGPARVDPSKPGKCALGGSDSAESAAPPARAGLAGLLRWRVRARPGQREVGAANCALLRRSPALDFAGRRFCTRATGPGVCIGPAPGLRPLQGRRARPGPYGPGRLRADTRPEWSQPQKLRAA